MRVALLSYRSKPHCGGQGIYIRHLSRELVNLGHSVEVFSGQPYPELDEGVTLTKLPSLDLYREPDPFRVPRLREFRDLTDVYEFGAMLTAAFPEPRTFSRRVAKLLARRTADFDVVHDNQTVGFGMLDIAEQLPFVETIHHPITFDRKVDLAHAPLKKQIPLRRWYSFLRMQGKVARRLPTFEDLGLNLRDVSRAELLEALDNLVERRHINLGHAVGRDGAAMDQAACGWFCEGSLFHSSQTATETPSNTSMRRERPFGAAAMAGREDRPGFTPRAGPVSPAAGSAACTGARPRRSRSPAARSARRAGRCRCPARR